MKQSEKNLIVINNFILHYTHDDVEMGCDEMYQTALEYIKEDWVDGKPADKGYEKPIYLAEMKALLKTKS